MGGGRKKRDVGGLGLGSMRKNQGDPANSYRNGRTTEGHRSKEKTVEDRGLERCMGQRANKNKNTMRSITVLNPKR